MAVRQFYFFSRTACMEMYKCPPSFGLHSVAGNEYNSTLKDKQCAGEPYLILAPDN